MLIQLFRTGVEVGVLLLGGAIGVVVNRIGQGLVVVEFGGGLVRMYSVLIPRTLYANQDVSTWK